jgi:hypothetical protein
MFTSFFIPIDLEHAQSAAFSGGSWLFFMTLKKSIA